MQGEIIGALIRVTIERYAAILPRSACAERYLLNVHVLSFNTMVNSERSAQFIVSHLGRRGTLRPELGHGRRLPCPRRGKKLQISPCENYHVDYY